MEYRRVSTNSSGGLSAQLMGEENYESEEGEDRASITFFLDLNLVYDLKGAGLEEANSHLILLEVTGKSCLLLLAFFIGIVFRK
jgi:hypothetical protein